MGFFSRIYLYMYIDLSYFKGCQWVKYARINLKKLSKPKYFFSDLFLFYFAILKR